MPLINEPLVFARDPITNDLIVPLRKVAGIEAVLILVRCAIELWAGEWFLDKDLGMPWLETPDGAVTERDAILGQAFDAAKAARAARRVILGGNGREGVPGAVELPELRCSFEGETRTLSVSFVVRTQFGDSELTTVAVTA